MSASSTTIIPVTVMSGAGNLFSVIDNRQRRYTPEFIAAHASEICKVRTDDCHCSEGILVLEEVRDATDVIVTFFNPDGSTSMMCGNGGRCAVRFAYALGALASDITHGRLHMAGTVFDFDADADFVTLRFAAPRAFDPDLTIDVDGRSLNVAYVDVGSDHAVIDRSEWERVFGSWSSDDFAARAPRIRSHPRFERGANVNVISIERASLLRLITFERGVEAVTRACGTGALACAVTAFACHVSHTREWTCIPPSEEPLHCTIGCDDDVDEASIDYLMLKGPARILSTTSITL